MSGAVQAGGPGGAHAQARRPRLEPGGVPEPEGRALALPPDPTTLATNTSSGVLSVIHPSFMISNILETRP